MTDDLTPKEAEYCRLVACSRLTKAAAYKQAFLRPDMTPAAASKAASRLSKLQKIQDKINGLRQRADDDGCMTLRERKLALSQMARESARVMAVSDAVKAIHELNLIDNVYKQEPAVNVAVGVQLITFDDLMREIETRNL